MYCVCQYCQKLHYDVTYNHHRKVSALAKADKETDRIQLGDARDGRGAECQNGPHNLQAGNQDRRPDTRGEHHGWHLANYIASCEYVARVRQLTAMHVERLFHLFLTSARITPR